MQNIYREYCYEVFDIEIKKENISNVSLNVVYNPLLKESGFLSPNIGEGKYKITINLFRFKDMSHEDKLFYIYNTICHEIEHIKPFEFTKKEDYYNYNHIMTLMEYITYLSELKLSPNKIDLGIKSKIIISKRLNKNYKVSLNEINSLLVGYKKAIKIDSFKNKKDTIGMIIEVLELLNNALEVNYGNNGAPLDNFGTYYLGTINYIKKYPEILNEYKVLNNFFTSDGEIKDIYTLYKNRNNENSSLYDKFILNIIISMSTNELTLHYIENDSEFREYVEKIVKDYMVQAMYFINNKDEVFFLEDEILNDNIIMMSRSVKKLNKLINDSKMKIKTLMIF